MRRLKMTFSSLFVLLVIHWAGGYLYGQNGLGLYDRIGIIAEHGLHGAVPEENIDLFTGNVSLRYLDIFLPGPNGLDVKVWRVYNSKLIRDRFSGGGPTIQQEPYSWVGLGWTMHMGRLHNPASETPMLEYPDGRQETLYRNKYDSSYFVSKDFAKYDRDQHKVYFRNGMIWTFGAQRTIYYVDHLETDVLSVIKIENSYGQHIDISYASNNAIMTTITDSFQRQITFYTDDGQPSYPKLTQIAVKNATGGLVYYNYSVGTFPNGSFYKLDQFDPPELPAATFLYKDGSNSQYELTKVTTPYGGYIRYDYGDRSFYYQNDIYILTRVVTNKWVKFTLTGIEKAWTYSYPDYHNVQTGTVSVVGPEYTQNVTYFAYSPGYEWRIGLVSQKTYSDNSLTESYSWLPQQISDMHWFVLSTDMGFATAPLAQSITKIPAGDASSREECQYSVDLIKYGLPSRINYYGNDLNTLINYKTIQYYFENHNSYNSQGRYLLDYISDETLKDSNNNTIKETQTQYYEQDNYWGTIDWVKRLRSSGAFLTWDYTFSYPSGTNHPEFIRININLPASAGEETYEYRYGILSKIIRQGSTNFTVLNRQISQYDSSISSETNQHGGTINFTYDGLGRTTTIDLPAGFNDITAQWATNDVTIAQGVTPGVNTVKKYWDGLGRDLGFVETGDGTTLYSRKSLDSEGRITEESKRTPISTDTYKYILNSSGQATKITDPRGEETNIAYSSYITTVTDAESRVTRLEYSGLPGLVKRLTDAQSRNALYTYDAIGRLTQVSYDNSARTQSYSYDGLDNITSENHPETGIISYTYTPENNLDQKIWGGVTQSHTYNAGNQLLSLSSGDETITYIYDTSGRISLISSSLGWSRTGITYNPFGSVLTETQLIPGLASKTLIYTYDGKNLPKETTYPDGVKLTLTNNGLNMPETLVFGTKSIISAMSYGPDKKPAAMTISGNGTVFNATYNSSGFLASAELKKGATTRYYTSYSYDGVGNILSTSSTAPTPIMNATYGYDPLNRLTSVTYTQGVGRVNSISYGYDNYGNMLSVQENGVTIPGFPKSYWSSNQVQGYGYDARGNLTSADGKYYLWDYKNRLRQIRDSSNQILGDYLYNERGLRIFALPPAPEITIKQGTNNIADGGSVTFTCPVNQYVDKTFTIENLGDANIILNGTPIITITGTDASQFSVQQQPTSPVLPAGSTSFTIRFQPNSAGNKTASITISNNDIDEGSYDIVLYGNNPVPEINVKQGANNVPDGGSVNISCGVGSFVDTSFAIENLGGGNLVLNGTPIIVISGANADQFSVQQQPTSPVLPAGSTSFVIRFQPTSAGNKTAAIAIVNNDSDESPYDITLLGHTPQPEIEIDQAPDGGTYDFGTIYIGDFWETTFTVMNFGDANLVLSGTPIVRVTGPGQSSFSVEQQPNATIPPGQTTSFVIRFSPMSQGTKTGYISIANNDADENPYNITLTGTGRIGPYKVSDDSSFIVTSPNEGEEIVAGSAMNITWRGGDSAKDVRIEYSSDNGSIYRIIADRIPNSGAYPWNVPQDISPSCLLRITDADGPLLVPKLMSYEFALKVSRRQDSPAGADQFTVHAGFPDKVNQIYRFADVSFTYDAPAQEGTLSFNSVPMATFDLSSLIEKWQQIRLQFDLSNETGSVWLDGQLFAENMPLNKAPGLQSAPDLSFSSSPKTKVWVDDIEVKLLNQIVKPQTDEEAQPIFEPLIWEGFNRYEAKKLPEIGGWRSDRSTLRESPEGLTEICTITAAEITGAGEAVQATAAESLSFVDDQEYVSVSRSLQLGPSITSVEVIKRVDLPAAVPFGISAGTFAIVAPASTRGQDSGDDTADRSGKRADKRMGEREYTRQNKPLLIAASAARAAARLSGAKTSAGNKPSSSDNEIKVLSASPVGSYYIYSYDGKLLAEYNTLGQWIRDYIYVGTQLIAEYRAGGTYYYYTSDQVNSTRMVTDGSGNVAYSVAYDPYGGIQKTWGTPSYTPSLKFSGKERDQESGLDYFGARYFYTAHYRWLSPDPIVPVDVALGDPQAWNAYSYVRNNPVNNFDPSGLYTFENGTPEQQAQFRSALGTLSSLIPYLAGQYGEEGEKNGVTVRFDEGKPSTRSSIEGDIQPTDRVTMPPDLAGDELIIAIAHEGRHIAIWRVWVLGLYLEEKLPNNGAVLSADWINLTEYADEVKAYEASVLAAKLLGKRELILSGFNIMKRGKVDMVSLNGLLAKDYGITPIVQGPRLGHRN